MTVYSGQLFMLSIFCLEMIVSNSPLSLLGTSGSELIVCNSVLLIWVMFLVENERLQ